MDAAQPGATVDPQMIREHGGDMEVLEKAIRDIELDALKQQALLSLAHRMPNTRTSH